MVNKSKSQEYNEYKPIRADLALTQNSLLPITPSTGDGREFGLHPMIPEVKELFDEGSLGFMANVGTLVEPTTLKSYESGLAKFPLGLYSHSDKIIHWQTSLPDQRSATGWGGRMADLLYAINNNDKISMNISLAGNNVFQTGHNTVEYSLAQHWPLLLKQLRQHAHWLHEQQPIHDAWRKPV